MVSSKKFLCALCVLGLVSDVYSASYVPIARCRVDAVQVPHTHTEVRTRIAEHRKLLAKLNQHMLAVEDGRKVSQDMVEDLRCESRNYVKRAQDALTDAPDVAAAGDVLTAKMQERIERAAFTEEGLRERCMVSDAEALNWWRRRQSKLVSQDPLAMHTSATTVRAAFANQPDEFRDAVLKCIVSCRLLEWSEELSCHTLTRDDREALLALLTPRGIEEYVRSFDVYGMAELLDAEYDNSSGLMLRLYENC